MLNKQILIFKMKDIRHILLRISFFYYLNSICSGCVDFTDNCTYCYGDSTCDRWGWGSYMDGTKDCKACISGCFIK